MNKTDYYSMKVKELLALCKGEPTYAGYSRFASDKAGLIDHMVRCDEFEQEQQAVEAEEESAPVAVPAIVKPEPLKPEEYIDSIAMGPAPLKYSRLKTVVSWGNWQFGVDAGFENLSIIQISTCRHWIALWDWDCLASVVDEITYGLERCGEVGELQLDAKKPPQLIPVFTANDDDDIDEEGEPARLPTPTPEFPPAALEEFRTGSKHEFYCPNCKNWMDRKGFTERLHSDFQERICNQCGGDDIWHWLESRCPALTPTDLFASEEKPPAAQPTIKDWLDNRGFRAQFQSLISCQSITIEKLWTLAETFTKQGGVRYLQVLNLESQESWFIHWDTQWKSFKDACRLFENVLDRCTAVDEILPPKPATYPTSTKYKMGERLCQLMGWNFEQWVRNASGENDSDRGSDPRRERVELPNVDEVCVNCNGTHLCPGRNHDCGCKSETDCPTLGWCTSCNDLPYHNLEPAVWEEVSA